MKPKNINIKDIRENFYYNEGKLFSKSKNVEVGWVCNGRYLMTDFNGQKHLVHRLIWGLFNDDIPDLIDHIDRDKLNNKIENLRASDKSSNAFNSYLRADNKSGFKGVYLRKDNGKWEVRHGNKYKGYYDTYEDAVKVKTNLLERDEIH